MTGALLQVTVRQWRLHRLRVTLTIMGVALGVAVFFAIRTTNTTLVDSLHSTIEKLAGKATLQIVAGDAGFSEEHVKTVRATAGVELCEPVTETTVKTVSLANEKLTVLGLDTASELKIYSEMFDNAGVDVKNPLAFTSRADSIAITRKFGDRYGLKNGDKITLQTQGGTQDFTIRGFFNSVGAGEMYDGNIAVMDIYAAQYAFERGSRIDRIDIMNSSDVSVDELERRLTAQLPAGIRVVRPEIRGRSLENSVSTMNFGLTIMSFLAFIICAFLIFNSFSISLSQRWKEIGVLRSLGVERGNVRRMFLAEAAAIGLIGSVIGVVVGFFIAKAALRIVLSVSTTIYGFSASPRTLAFDYRFAVESFLVGIAASLIAAWLPARAAARLDPAVALYNVEMRKREVIAGKARIIIAFACILLGLGLTTISTPATGKNVQLFYSFFIQFGMILLLPNLIQVGARLIRPVMKFVFGPEGQMAVETLVRAPRRTSSTVGALMVGLAFVFSSGAFVISQKAALNHQIDKSLNADVLLTSSEQLQARTYHFSQTTTDRVLSLPGIERADALRIGTIEYGGQTVSVLAHDMDAYFAISPDLLDYGDPKTARDATVRGEGVLVSNNLALRWGLNLGDSIRLDTPGGSLYLPVVGMLDYYRSEVGTIFIDRSIYQKYWNDNDVDYILIDLKPGIDAYRFKQSILGVISSDQNAFVYTHDEFKLWVSRLIDQFFTLMYLQMVVAIFVASLGLMNTMIISVDERKRELGIFRAIGGLRRQVVKMVLIEAVAISMIGLAAGVITGIFNAYFLVYTAAKVVAGFRLQLIFPVSIVLIAIPMVIIVAILSAWLPARSASRLNVIEAIGYE